MYCIDGCMVIRVGKTGSFGPWSRVIVYASKMSFCQNDPPIYSPNSTNVMNCTVKKKATYTSPDASMFEPDGSDFLAFLAGI